MDLKAGNHGFVRRSGVFHSQLGAGRDGGKGARKDCAAVLIRPRSEGSQSTVISLVSVVLDFDLKAVHRFFHRTIQSVYTRNLHNIQRGCQSYGGICDQNKRLVAYPTSA